MDRLDGNVRNFLATVEVMNDGRVSLLVDEGDLFIFICVFVFFYALFIRLSVYSMKNYEIISFTS